MLQTTGIEQKLQQMGLELPEPPKPSGSYEPAMVCEDTLYISGVTPKRNGILTAKGTVGRDLTVEEAAEAARTCALLLLSMIKSAIGNLDRIDRLVKITGYVCSDSSFTQHPKVIDGASQLFLELFGDKGKHVRCAIGAASLPGGAAVEIDAVVKIREVV